jgi:hypothetical protein
MVALADIAIGVFVLASAAFVCMMAYALYKSVNEKK